MSTGSNTAKVAKHLFGSIPSICVYYRTEYVYLLTDVYSFLSISLSLSLSLLFVCDSTTLNRFHLLRVSSAFLRNFSSGYLCIHSSPSSLIFSSPSSKSCFSTPPSYYSSSSSGLEEDLALSLIWFRLVFVGFIQSAPIDSICQHFHSS